MVMKGWVQSGVVRRVAGEDAAKSPPLNVAFCHPNGRAYWALARTDGVQSTYDVLFRAGMGK